MLAQKNALIAAPSAKVAVEIMEVQPGMEVFDANNDYLGRVLSVGNGFIHIQKGMIRAVHTYAAIDHVQAMNEETVVLSQSKADLHAFGWYASRSTSGTHAVPQMISRPQMHKDEAREETAA